jgi:hypothetical protein
MIYSSESGNNIIYREMLKNFHETYFKFHADKEKQLNSIKGDNGLTKIFYKKYPFMKKKNTNCRSLIYNLFEYDEFKDYNTSEFKSYLIEYCIKKIRGIYKHGQSAKTEIACEKIASDLNKNIMTIAITKNTLLANKQFTTRFIAYLKKLKYTNLKEIVMVISSEKNDLDGNATHCKTLDEAWGRITSTNNSYKVIFVCSNKTRITDINNLLYRYNQSCFNKELLKKIVIQYDEAHNLMSGIPPFREHIESLLLFDFVKEFVPITASKNPIHDDNNPLWKESNLKKTRLNFINEELYQTKILSTDSQYSSIDDALPISYEEYYEYENYNNLFKQETFKEVYGDNKSFERFGRVNACNLPMLGDEELAMNSAKTIFKNNEEFSYITDTIDEEEHYKKIFLPDEFNLHIVITPGRKIITRELGDYIAKLPYNPVVIMFYGSKNSYKYRDLEKGVIIRSGKDKGIICKDSEEFNESLNNWLISKKLEKRCVIILGNYQCVGESNTFVNYKYGYVRSAVLLPGCNLSPEECYQFLLRCCFLLGKFKGLTKNKITKFIIGPKEGIQDALQYEKINDDLVQDLINNKSEENEENNFVQELEINGGNVRIDKNVDKSIPIQFKIEDFESDNVYELRQIMAIETRTELDKAKFMKILNDCIEEESITASDKNENKINLNSYILKEFRCYRDGLGDSYRFKLVHDHFIAKEPLLIGELEKGECGIYCCLKKHKDHHGHINNINTFYLLFALK